MVEKAGTNIESGHLRKMRKMLGRNTLQELERDYLKFLADGWNIDPDFKDTQPVTETLKALHEGNIAGMVTLGMFKMVEVDLAMENAELRETIKKLEAELKMFREDDAKSDIHSDVIADSLQA